MNDDRKFELRIDKTTFVVNAINAEKSRDTACKLLKKLIVSEIDGTENFARAH